MVGTYPFERDLGSRLDWYAGAVALAELVAYDIDGAEAIGRHEAVVEVVGLPSDCWWDGSLVTKGSIPALIGDAISDDFVDVTMGSDERWQRNGGDVGLHDCERLECEG